MNKSCQSRDSNPQPRVNKSDALSTRPRLPPWHGIPKELVCDHVPFAGYEMKTFAAEWGINLTHSSPVYPQSNRLAERTIKTIKHDLNKEEQSGVDHHLALLSLRNTPITGTSSSPAQVLMGRVLRSTSVQLLPKVFISRSKTCKRSKRVTAMWEQKPCLNYMQEILCTMKQTECGNRVSLFQNEMSQDRITSSMKQDNSSATTGAT